MTNSTNGVWETSDLLTPEMIDEDRETLLDILNALPDRVSLTQGTFVLPNGRIWTFRMLGTAVVV